MIRYNQLPYHTGFEQDDTDVMLVVNVLRDIGRNKKETHLGIIPFKEVQKRGLRPSSALDTPKSNEIISSAFNVLQVEQQILHPHAYAPANGGGLGRLKVGTTEAGYVAVSTRLLSQSCSAAGNSGSQESEGVT